MRLEIRYSKQGDKFWVYDDTLEVGFFNTDGDIFTAQRLVEDLAAWANYDIIISVENEDRELEL